MNELFNHLWQSTAFAAVIATVCFLLRRNRARIRYWLWLTASLKFLLPFSLLVSLGDGLGRPIDSPPLAAITVERMATTFSPATLFPVPARPSSRQLPWPAVFGVIWAAGAAFILRRWLMQWRRLRRNARCGKPLPLALPVPVLVTKSLIEPGIFGIIRPILLLPEGLPEKLTPEQFRTILAHELCHVRERDNLFAALHMFVQALFWFYPLVWWIGTKLIEERERACDESVVAQGSSADDYVAGILGVCKFCLESPLPCAAGVTGSDLKKRIREIMTPQLVSQLTVTRKALLAMAGCGLCALPLLIGILRAQTLPPPPKYGYEVATIRPAAPGQGNERINPGPQGGLRVQNKTTMALMRFAYDLQEFQFANVPLWVKTDHYDLVMTPDKPEVPPGPGTTREEMEAFFRRNQQRMQALLRDRLGLVLRVESKEQPLYVLVVASGGHKMKRAADPKRRTNHNYGRGRTTGTSAPIDLLVWTLALNLGRHVTDETGLTGPFDFTLQWMPDAGANPGETSADATGPSLFTALTEQLGLKLEARKGPAPVFVIEKIERPSEN